MRKYRSLLTTLLILLLLDLMVVFAGFASPPHDQSCLAEEVVEVMDGAVEEIFEEEAGSFSESTFSECCVLVVSTPIHGHSLCRRSLAAPAFLAFGWIVPLRI